MDRLVIDTSALMSLLLGESVSEKIKDCICITEEILISAGTLSELLIVARAKGVYDETYTLLEELKIHIMPLTKADAYSVAEAYAKWGKGIHPAGLNFGDCFAYTLAKVNDLPLLFVGQDFNKTDIASVL
jgi:ribonuclease VapC